MPRMLESAEAARRLGVKLPTLYAYVSRGLIVSHRSPDGRTSRFAADDVEALARRSRGARTTETRLATVTTGVTQLDEEVGPIYRGQPATELATSAPYEAAAETLWAADEPAPLPWKTVDLRPPATLSTSDRIRWAVVMAGARDPLRADLRPEAVRMVARKLVATLASVLAPSSGSLTRRSVPPLELPARTPLDSVVAVMLASRLAPDPSPAVVRAINAALVLLADHELATSTVAVRVAASARSDLYDAVLAGLGVVAGPLHGGASQLAYTMLRDAERSGPDQALNDALRWQRRLPGFGHPIYQGTDPRFTVLRSMVDDLGSPRLSEMLETLTRRAAERDIPGPNVDLGLAALTVATGMPDDAGRTLFTIARVAGWAAHYLEELEERPIRYRLRGVYAARS